MITFKNSSPRRRVLCVRYTLATMGLLYKFSASARQSELGTNKMRKQRRKVLPSRMPEGTIWHEAVDLLAMQGTSDDKKEQHWPESENCRIDMSWG